MYKTVTVMGQNVRSNVLVYGIIKGPVFATYKLLIVLNLTFCDDQNSNFISLKIVF
jgi:hypothetical protein